MDSFNTTHTNAFLTVNGECMKVLYGITSQWPILYTAPGFLSYNTYVDTKALNDGPTDVTQPQNLRKGGAGPEIFPNQV